MAQSKAQMKSNGDKASPCFKPFLTGNGSDKTVSLSNVIKCAACVSHAALRAVRISNVAICAAAVSNVTF